MMNEIIQTAIEKYKPVKIFALFSGGNDSMCSTHQAMENGAHEVLHINTGIGIEKTREFVRETCKAYNWPLREEFPPDMSYRDFVLKYGFPGPAAHRYCYSWLKERALNKVVRETKRRIRDRVMLISGVRNLESTRRMGYNEPVSRKGAKVWVAGIFHYSTIDLHEYRQKHGLPMSEVSKKLGLSGECLCGAFASKGELQQIKIHYPSDAKKITDLQEEANLAGVHCIWGEAPLEVDKHTMDMFMPMCAGCNESKIRQNGRQLAK